MAAAGENLLVIEGRATKLGVVNWSYDRDHPGAPWRFQSPDGAVDLTLTPVRPLTGGINLVLKYSVLTKAHGGLTGTLRLPDGTVLQVDTPTAFAEEMQIRW
jgi:hypothetical protein